MKKISILAGILLVLISLMAPTAREGILNIGLLQTQMMVFHAGLASLIVAAILSVGDQIAGEEEPVEEIEEGDTL